MRKKYNNLYFSLLSIITFSLIIVQPVHAADEKGNIPNPLDGIDNIGGLISRASAVTTPLAIVGLIATVIYGGYTRMTAMGNADKEQKSSAILVAAFIGFAIIAFAPLLVRIIGNLLGIKTDVIS